MNKKGGENGEFSSRRKIVRLVPFHPFYPPSPRLELLFPGGEREIYSRHGICIRPAAGF